MRVQNMFKCTYFKQRDMFFMLRTGKKSMICICKTKDCQVILSLSLTSNQTKLSSGYRSSHLLDQFNCKTKLYCFRIVFFSHEFLLKHIYIYGTKKVYLQILWAVLKCRCAKICYSFKLTYYPLFIFENFVCIYI